MPANIGIDCKLYVNQGTHDVPDWLEVRYVRDNQLNQEAGEVDVTSRASGRYKQVIPGLFEAGFEFDIRWKPADAAFALIHAAYHAQAAIEMLALDGDIETGGSQGLLATMAVFNFSRPEKMEEGTVATVVVKPTEADNPPEWVMISA